MGRTIEELEGQAGKSSRYGECLCSVESQLGWQCQHRAPTGDPKHERGDSSREDDINEQRRTPLLQDEHRTDEPETYCQYNREAQPVSICEADNDTAKRTDC